MSTSGFVGFVVDGIEKIGYVHFDAYPSGVGVDVVKWLSAVEDFGPFADQARALIVIDGQTPPTPEDVERLRPWTNLNVGERSTEDWYCLLRETQGRPDQMLASGYIEDAGGFPADSLFCEWGYLVDLDDRRLEVFQGFQDQSHTKGRFAERTDLRDTSATGTSYHPVALVASWSLDDLPTVEDFVAAVEQEDD